MSSDRSNPSRTVYTLGNLVIALWLSGAVVFISDHLTQIPVAVFIGLFTALTLGCLGAARHYRQRQETGWTRTAAYWAGIFYGIAVIATAHRLDLLSFVPDLILVWVVGLLMIASWVRHPVLWGFAQSLGLVWLLCTFLYGQSYLPGLAIFAWVSLSFTSALRADASPATARFVLHLVYGIVLFHLYAYDLLWPAHFPLQLPTALLAASASCFALLWSLGHWSPLTQRVPTMARVLRLGGLLPGVALLVAAQGVIDPAPLAAGLASGRVSATGLIGTVLLVSAAVCCWTTPREARTAWVGWLFWSLGTFLLLMGLSEPHSVVGIHFNTLARALALGLGVYSLVVGALRPCVYRLLGGVALLGISLGSAWVQRGLDASWAIALLWLLACALGWGSMRYARRRNQGADSLEGAAA